MLRTLLLQPEVRLENTKPCIGQYMDVLDFPPPATGQIQIAPGKAKLRLGAGIVACLIVFAEKHFPKSLGETPLTNPDLILSSNLRKCIDTASSALAGYTLALEARPLPGRSH